MSLTNRKKTNTNFCASLLARFTHRQDQKNDFMSQISARVSPPSAAGPTTYWCLRSWRLQKYIFCKSPVRGNICWHLELSVQSDVNTAAVTAENPKVSFIQSSEFIWQVLEIISCFKVSTYFWPYSIFLFELCQRCKKQQTKKH